MNGISDLHDELNDIRRDGRRQGFVLGMTAVTGIYAFVKLRKQYKIVKRDTANRVHAMD